MLIYCWYSSSAPLLPVPLKYHKTRKNCYPLIYSFISEHYPSDTFCKHQSFIELFIQDNLVLQEGEKKRKINTIYLHEEGGRRRKMSVFIHWYDFEIFNAKASLITEGCALGFIVIKVPKANEYIKIIIICFAHYA